jgi:hypothetical protein
MSVKSNSEIDERKQSKESVPIFEMSQFKQFQFANLIIQAIQVISKFFQTIVPAQQIL